VRVWFDRDHTTRIARSACLLFPILLALGSAQPGCGGASSAPAGAGSNQVVKGKVVLASGKPLTRGRVVLTPKQEPMLPLFGDIEPDGSFTLKAGGFVVGVSHGDFLVSVEPPGYLAGSRAKPKNLAFPARYLDPENGLTATIAPETSELPAIELK
jgi:hypothetical protein